MPALRFVLLEHDWDGVHYDLMLERDAALKTWRLQAPPGDQAQDAVPLPDHRLQYLDYEGPISGGRGVVRRVARGTYEPLGNAEDRFLLRGDGLQGILHIRDCAGRTQIWMEAEPGKGGDEEE